jgi:hypothetical protein
MRLRQSFPQWNTLPQIQNSCKAPRRVGEELSCLIGFPKGYRASQNIYIYVPPKATIR